MWAAAALPIGVLGWLGVPVLARFTGAENVPMAKALITALAVGQVLLFVLVVALMARAAEPALVDAPREERWLRSPRSPRSGRIGGQVWLVVIPLIVAFAALNLFLPGLTGPESHDLN